MIISNKTFIKARELCFPNIEFCIATDELKSLSLCLRLNSPATLLDGPQMFKVSFLKFQCGIEKYPGLIAVLLTNYKRIQNNVAVII